MEVEGCSLTLKGVQFEVKGWSTSTYYILVQEKISLLDIRFCCLNSLHITFADTTVGF